MGFNSGIFGIKKLFGFGNASVKKFIMASGGFSYAIGDDMVHVFTSSGFFTLIQEASNPLDNVFRVLVVPGGGGGATSGNASFGLGGLGGGGDAQNGFGRASSPGFANTGGGGGGAFGVASPGGSGIVVIRYKFQ